MKHTFGSRHPLNIAFTYYSMIAAAVTMLHTASISKRDRRESPVRVCPHSTRDTGCHRHCSIIVEQQERIHIIPAHSRHLRYEVVNPESVTYHMRLLRVSHKVYLFSFHICCPFSDIMVIVTTPDILQHRCQHVARQDNFSRARPTAYFCHKR